MHLNKNLYQQAVIITGISAVCIAACCLVIGDKSFFLMINGNGGYFLDHFFTIVTALGEATAWIVTILLFIFFKKKYLPLCIITLVISTIIAQGIKRVLPEQARPSKAFVDASLYHTAKGTDLHKVNSFPSGHTTAAFSVFLLGCLVLSQKWFLPIGYLYALLVGYSRVYLAQHFPKDIAGGMFAAIIATMLALFFQNKYFSKKHSSH
ncbi:MAG: phosphatase PAP2 family protein [Chitinophagaceae bacterium]|jgi:membrane-associated phospholipid phosphatase